MSMSERETLLNAKLIEQKITFPDIQCNTEECKSILIEHFSRLADCGGYEVLRLGPNV